MALKKLDSILESGREVLYLDRLSILRADPQERWLQATVTSGTEEHLEAIRIPLGPEGGRLAEAYLTKQLIVSDGDSPLPENLRLQPPYDQISSLRSQVFAIVPLILQDRAIGVLAADRTSNRVPFAASTLESLKSMATQAALALEHGRLYAAAQPVISRSLHLSEVYPAFARAVRALLPYDRIGVVVPEKKSLVMALSVAEPPLANWQGQTWENVEGTAVEWVLKNSQPLVVKDLSAEQRFADSAFIAKEGIRSSLMVPLLAGGATVGVFFLDSLTRAAYTEEEHFPGRPSCSAARTRHRQHAPVPGH